MKSKLLFLMFFVSINFIYGQYIDNLIEYNGDIVKTNPAFAGALEQPTLSLYDNFVHHFSGSNYTGEPYFDGFTYQQYYDKIKGGISINYNYEQLDLLHTYNLNIAYSPTIKLGNDWAFKPAVGLGYINNSVQPYSITNYNYPVYPVKYPYYPTYTITNYPAFYSHYYDFNAGALLYSHNFSIGIAFHDINNPVSINQDLINIDNSSYTNPVIFSINCNYNFLSDDNGKTWAIAPNINCDYNGHLFYFGSTFKYKWFLFGISSRTFSIDETGYFSNIYLLPMIGFQNKLFRITYCNFDDYYSNYTEGFLNENGSPYRFENINHEIQLTINLPVKGNHFKPPVFTQVY